MSEFPSQPGHPDLNPGDVAPADAESAGEDLCPHCGGSGKHGDADCDVCGGTGKVVEGIGGG
jgi:hypothetical protein